MSACAHQRLLFTHPTLVTQDTTLFSEICRFPFTCPFVLTRLYSRESHAPLTADRCRRQCLPTRSRLLPGSLAVSLTSEIILGYDASPTTSQRSRSQGNWPLGPSPGTSLPSPRRRPRRPGTGPSRRQDRPSRPGLLVSKIRLTLPRRTQREDRPSRKADRRKQHETGI